MIRIGLCAALAVVAGTIYAQVPAGEAAKSSPLPEARMEAAGELKDSVPARPAQNDARAKADADARHCLDLSTNAQVHRCAEGYRNRKAGVRSTAARPKTARAPAKGNVLDIPKDAAPAAKAAQSKPTK
ncbi:MAG: hypothetical protein ACXW2I_04390 [Burkholderiales bacterium]